LRNSLLEIDSVQKKFGHNWIISDAYLSCKTGEILGLLGKNGCGKSTLLKIIFGILPADNKFVRIDGTVKSRTSELLQDISYLSQENFIPGNLRVKKAIALTIRSAETNLFQQDELIRSILDKKIHQLSGGELRYLEIKLILSNESKFALLDEPYNGLSPLMIAKINALVLENAKAKGIIITDHNYQNIIAVSNRLLLMQDGKLHHLTDENQLIERGYLNNGMR
jgi:ABC-type multidrug transport system ATPase subunit